MAVGLNEHDPNSNYTPVHDDGVDDQHSAGHHPAGPGVEGKIIHKRRSRMGNLGSRFQ
jgi:hypothetical protein